MRVAVITPVYPPYRGGIGSVASGDVARLRAAGFSVTVFTPSYDRLEENMANVERLQPVFSYGNAAVTPSLFFRLKGFDAVHVHYPCYGMDLFAVLGAWWYRIPLFLTYHMKTRTKDWRNVFFVLHRICIEPITFLFAKRIFVSSVDYAQFAKIDEKKMYVLPFGVDTEFFHPAVKSLATDSPLKMIFVGGLDQAHDFKGLDTLLSALTNLPHAAYELWVVGSGDRQRYFTELAKNLGIAERVHFYGNVSREELAERYRNADLHILPSLNQGEAFGLVTLEAAASGIPSIVSDLPGVRTVVVDGETGRCFPPGNAFALSEVVKEFVHDREQTARMGQKARERAVREFDERVVAERFVKAYNELL